MENNKCINRFIKRLVLVLILFAFFFSFNTNVKAAIVNIGDTENYGYTGDVQTFTAPYTGVYKLRTWGAQGGSTHGFAGGGGGYSEGKVHLNAGDTLYIYVGGQGAAASAPGESLAGGYNGGGSVTGDSSVNHYTTSGGGATHIATVSGLLSTLENQKDKILIVSGGGGGATWQQNYDEFSGGARQGPGGSGGGSNGLFYLQTGVNSWIESTYADTTLIAGTQTAGYAFGQGASNTGGSAGGGGFYGGKTYQRAGAGGSGYVGNPLLTDKHMTMYATNADYNNSKTNPNTSITTAASETPTDDTPKAGWGYAKVTFLGNNDTTLKTLTVSGYEIMPALRSDKRDYIVFVNENETSLTLNAETNDTKASVSYNSTVSITENTTTETLTVTAEDGTVGIYTLNIYKQIPSDMGGEYAYTGDVQTFTATKGGLYKIETWGAQGGSVNSTYVGGYGGYSTGVVKLKKGETVYIYVGGQGSFSNTTEITGGYNGGGSANGGLCPAAEDYRPGASGGGATHIATQSGLLSTLENNRDSILIVSGGGGASNNYGGIGNGGSAGGIKGNTATYTLNLGHTLELYATGGTQTSGGTGGNSYNETIQDLKGSFGQGGNNPLTNCNEGNGGGGGYYGGGASRFVPSAGGSGYIGSTRLTTTDQVTKHMSCYNCATSDDESTKTISNTCHSSAATADCAKEGDGYARIMFIEEYTSDATLSFLSVTNYELDKKFNSNKYEYSLPTFEETVETIEINATPNDYNATVSGDGIINVPYGKSTHEIIVTAQDGTIGIYKIKLNREATPEDEYSYNYTGDVQEFIAPVTGKYKLETWGAQGGSADNTYTGGYGAYSTGTISLKANQKVYIYVGGEGQTTTNGYSESVAGGYNGGGSANTSITSCSSATQYKSSGGGATHMATTSGLLNTLENNKSNILIVSAGGGGGSLLSDDSCYNQHSKSNGGSGAGYKSKVESFEEIDYQENYTCYPATQNSSGYCTYNSETKGPGSFGVGGSYVIGGGGGYYGGASGTDKKSQGGVSYIGNTKLIDKHMTCYNCETSTEESTKTSSTACFSISPKEDCAKRGNGYAKITPLGIESEDATLKSLTVTDQELKQAFDPERLNYDLILDEDATSVEITAEANDGKASLTYNQNVELTSNPQLEEIIVTAEDGTINVYSINIKRVKKSYLKKWNDTRFDLIADNQSDSITALRKATTAEYNAAKDSFSDLNTISLANSPYPAYAWKDNDSILFYSEADIVYMNPDSRQYFMTFKNATSIDLSFFDTSKVTSMIYMFKGLSKLTSLDLSNFDTSNVTIMMGMFSGLSSITSLDVSNFDTENVTDMSYMFENVKVETIDLSNFDTSKVTNMYGMFQNTIAQDGIDLSSFDTSNVTSMSHMFYNTKTPKLDLKHFDVSKVNNFSSIFTLTDVDEIDISGWVFNVSSLSSIFYKSKVTKLILDDVDTSSLTTMRSMFSGLLKLKEVDLSSLDTENVTDMSYMFYASDSIETLDLSSFDTRKVTTMENMFTTNNGETALRSINLSGWKVYNVTTMYGMFENAKHLESIDLSSFDVSSVTTMERMFSSCNSLKTVDLSNFNSPQLTNISGMFGSNNNLERIYANESFSTENVVYSKVFGGCGKLVGGMGTMYSLSNIDSTYARVDDPENGRPGYFTYKEFKPTIYYPDDTFEEVTFNSLFTFPENWPKENENVSTVTFKYQNGEEDYISNVTKSFDLYRWKVNDNTYSPSSDKNIIADTYLEPIYNETIEGAEFPENPTSEHGTFLGWYTEPTGGERVTSYNGEEDITLYAHWNYDNMNISFEENGGEEISDIAIPYGSEIGELPTTTKTGFILEGWYSDEELTNKILSSTVVNDDIILYAKWIEDDFPIVYQDDEEVFDGTNYLNTHIKLYNEENISKDYEIGFTIEEFDESIQEQYATFTQDMYELESSEYPGLVIRMDNNDSVLKTNIKHRKENGNYGSIYIDNYPVVKKVRIVRKDNIIYYSVNDGELSVLHNFNNFTNYFETEATFGAALDENNNPYRFLKGKLSNMYIRLGEAQDDHMVTYPDGNVEIYPHNTIITLGTNNSSKADEEGATVTFKYHNDMEDTTSKVIDKYLANGFKVSDTHYDNSSTLLVDSDKIIEYDYDKISSTTFPEDPTKEKFKFDGWYTEEDGGDKVESYEGTEDITLHAHWIEMVTITYPNQTVEVPKDENYELLENNIEKDPDNKATVTFKYHNGNEDTTSYVKQTYYGYGWKDQYDNTYSNYETIRPTEDLLLTPDYYEDNNGEAEFPENPKREGYAFLGWFDEETGGTEYTSYNENEDITLHAQWTDDYVIITLPGEDPIPVPRGEGFELPSNDINKDPDILATVTFKYHNGDADTTSTVKKNYTPDGWKDQNGNTYSDSEYIYPTEDLTFVPKYIETIEGAEFPNNPEKENETFSGWFDDEIGGNIYFSYNEEEDITLHAQYDVGGYAYLVEGNDIHNKFNRSQTGIFRKATIEEYNLVKDSLTSDNIISKSRSPLPVYMWQSEEDVYYYSTAQKIYVNEDASKMFSNASFNSIDISGLDTSMTKDMSMMFYSCSKIETINLGNINTSKVTDMSRMFAYFGYQGNAPISLDLSNFDTSNVTDMNHMFQDSSKITEINLSSFDTSKVVDMQYMFFDCRSLVSLDLSNFDTSKVTNMSYMFYSANNLTSLDISSFDTKNVTNMAGMFYGTNLRTINIYHFDVAKVTRMDYMFSEMPNLEELTLSNYYNRKAINKEKMFSNTPKLEVVDISNFDSKTTNDISRMFYNDTNLTTIYAAKDGWPVLSNASSTWAFRDSTNLVGGEGTIYDVNNVGKEYAIVDDAENGKPGYFTDASAIRVQHDVTFHYKDGDVVEKHNHDSILTLEENDNGVIVKNYGTVTFKYHDDVTEDTQINPSEVITSNGWLVNGVHYDDEGKVVIDEDKEIDYDFITVKADYEFPTPEREDYRFIGWFTEETGGEEVTEYTGEDPITLHAHWGGSLPEDIELDTDDITMVVGDVHQVVVTFTPEGATDTLTYTGYDNEIISITDGLITGLSKGTTTITIGTENTDIEKTISITVLSDKLESTNYTVTDKVRPKENEEDPDITDRIIIGAEPGTLISEFKENMLNPVNYIKIYDQDNNELSEDDIVKTGLTIKLEINGIVHDEAIIIIRGDINEDGLVNVIDKSILSEHILRLNNIEGYRTYAADVDNNDSINITDKSKLSEYILRLIDTLNE